MIRENVVDFTVKPLRTFWAAFLLNVGPILLLIVFWWMMANRGEQLGNRVMSFGRIKPK